MPPSLRNLWQPAHTFTGFSSKTTFKEHESSIKMSKSMFFLAALCALFFVCHGASAQAPSTNVQVSIEENDAVSGDSSNIIEVERSWKKKYSGHKKKKCKYVYKCKYCKKVCKPVCVKYYKGHKYYKKCKKYVKKCFKKCKYCGYKYVCRKY